MNRDDNVYIFNAFLIFFFTAMVSLDFKDKYRIPFESWGALSLSILLDDAATPSYYFAAFAVCKVPVYNPAIFYFNTLVTHHHNNITTVPTDAQYIFFVMLMQTDSFLTIISIPKFSSNNICITHTPTINITIGKQSSYTMTIYEQLNFEIVYVIPQNQPRQLFSK